MKIGQEARIEKSSKDYKIVIKSTKRGTFLMPLLLYKVSNGRARQE